MVHLFAFLTQQPFFPFWADCGDLSPGAGVPVKPGSGAVSMVCIHWRSLYPSGDVLGQP